MWLALLFLVGLVAAIVYAELVLAEGTHLGQRVVTALYNRSANRYETIKQFDATSDDLDLGVPITLHLLETNQPHAAVLDVACGTARLGRTLLRQDEFRGPVMSLDLAQKMLLAARQLTATPQINYLQATAHHLPFASNQFAVVACLEAFEFTPNPAQALAECVRVLQPGGLLVISNRVGWDRWLLWGKIWTRPQFEAQLASLPLIDVNIRPWLDIYDLALAKKEHP